MRSALVLLFVSALLVGCSTAGNLLRKTGQVLMDPSIPVGALEDQPTQVALSLYASADVNPNPVSASMLDGSDEIGILEDHGPFSVNINSTTKGELVASLQGLLAHLGTGTAAGYASPFSGLAKPSLKGSPPKLSGHPFTLGRLFPEVIVEPIPDSAVIPAHWFIRQVSGQREEPEVAASVDDLDLGQYRKNSGVALAQRQSPKPPITSTPVAFRVLQLKDDSMLENADLELIHAAPEKALGSTLISADNYILAPGQFKFIEFSAVDEKTRYLAVVASFHDPNATRWYDVFRIDSRGRTYALLVTLQETRIAITDEAYRPQYPRPGSATHARNTP